MNTDLTIARAAVRMSRAGHSPQMVTGGLIVLMGAAIAFRFLADRVALNRISPLLPGIFIFIS